MPGFQIPSSEEMQREIEQVLESFLGLPMVDNSEFIIHNSVSQIVDRYYQIGGMVDDVHGEPILNRDEADVVVTRSGSHSMSIQIVRKHQSPYRPPKSTVR